MAGNFHMTSENKTQEFIKEIANATKFIEVKYVPGNGDIIKKHIN